MPVTTKQESQRSKYRSKFCSSAIGPQLVTRRILTIRETAVAQRLRSSKATVLYSPRAEVMGRIVISKTLQMRAWSWAARHWRLRTSKWWSCSAAAHLASSGRSDAVAMVKSTRSRVFLCRKRSSLIRSISTVIFKRWKSWLTLNIRTSSAWLLHSQDLTLASMIANCEVSRYHFHHQSVDKIQDLLTIRSREAA